MEKQQKSKASDRINELMNIARFGPTTWQESPTAAVGRLTNKHLTKL